MSVQYISSGLEWTEPMISLARQRIANPLIKRIPNDDVEVSILLRDGRKRKGGAGLRYSMTVMLKSRDQQNIEMIDGSGDDFFDLTNTISSGMREALKNKNLI
jgi:hypothetical protein